MGGSNLDGLHHRVHPVSEPPAPKISRHWQYFVANLGLSVVRDFETGGILI